MSLYQPTYLQPNGIDIDASVSNSFSFTIRGNIVTAYQIFIYNNSTNTLVYNPSIVNISSTPKYNDESISITVPNSSGMTNSTTSDYKFKIRLWENYSSFPSVYVDSSEVFFRCRNNPSISILNFDSTIDIKSFTFVGSYYQQQGISIKWFSFELYDNNQVLIDSTNKIFSSKIEYTFDGFISGEHYGVRLYGENQNGTSIDTGILSFSVLYNEPQLMSKPSLTPLPDKDAIQVSWSQSYTIPGNSQIANAYELHPDIFYTGDNSCHIFSGNSLYYDKVNSQTMNLPDNITSYLKINLPLGFTGNILKLDNADSNKTITVSYDGTKFVYQIGSTTGNYVDLNARGDDVWWLIVVLPNSVQFIKYEFNVLLPSDTLYPSDILYPIFTLK